MCVGGAGVCGGVLKAFSKSRMKLSTCLPLSKILAQPYVVTMIS